MKQAVISAGRVLDRIFDLLELITGYGVFVFMALLFFQVVMRFVFKHPVYGVDESVTALMIWTMCLGWCTVYWQNGHAVLEFIMKKMPPVGGLPFCKAYYYALPVLVMGIIMLIMSVYKTIAFLVTGDESICVPEEKEGGGVLD